MFDLYTLYNMVATRHTWNMTAVNGDCFKCKIQQYFEDLVLYKDKIKISQ